MCTAVAAAREIVVDSLPPSAFVDTETSTNWVFDAGSELGREFLLRLILDASPSNNVTVSFGIDADGDGSLSPSEADLDVGWDCGAWFFRDRRDGTIEFAPSGDGRRTLEWRTTLDEDKKPKYAFAKDSGETVFALRATDGMFLNGWNLLRVAARGLGGQNFAVATRVRPLGLEVRFR